MSTVTINLIQRNTERKWLENICRTNFVCIHLPASELFDLEEELEIKLSNGHQYTGPQTGIVKIELHVDSHPSFQERMNGTTMFGRILSVRKPLNTKPLIGFGQDKFILKQYLFTSKAWTTPDEQKPVILRNWGGSC